jgi:hypothetical protein
MNTPKIAVLMFGNMRSYNVTYRNMENYLLKPYNCDLYITTYNKRFNIKHGEQIKEEIMTPEIIQKQYEPYIKQVTIVNQDEFIERYNRNLEKKYSFGGELDRLFTIQKLAMLAYDIFRGECVRNNRKYDIIIRMRPDILLNERLILNTQLNENQIIVPDHNTGGEFNDHMAYGRNKAMTKYLTYYGYFKDLDEENMCDVSIVEGGLKKHLELQGVDIHRVSIKYTILRDTRMQKVVYAGKGKFFVKKY